MFVDRFQREGFEEERAFKKSPEFANWLTRVIDPLSLSLGLGVLKCVQHADTEPPFHQLAQGEPVATSSSLNGRRPEYVRCLLKKLPVSSSLKTLEMRSSRITDELAVRP